MSDADKRTFAGIKIDKHNEAIRFIASDICKAARKQDTDEISFLLDCMEYEATLLAGWHKRLKELDDSSS